jgi:hypothetical protein
MAFCAARAVNTVQTKADRPDCERLLHADRLAEREIARIGWLPEVLQPTALPSL